MTVFWIVVALFVIGALLMLLPALWTPRPPEALATAGGLNLAVYRDQLGEAERDVGIGLMAPEQLALARGDIERRLLEDVTPAAEPAAPRAARPTAYALAILIPLGSVATYLVLGDQQAMSAAIAGGGKAAPAASADGRHSLTPEQIQQMVTSLAERLKADPNNAEGWMMLGRSYTSLGRHRDAVTALRRANELAPGNATLLADLADLQGVVQGKRLAGEPARLVQQALDADPRHPKALALAGSVAFEARDYTAAGAYWERAVAVLPPGSDIARSLQGSIEQARRAAATADAAQGAAAGPARTLAGEVSVSPELAARVGPGDTLFIFARAVDGPRIPLAIVRRPVGAWPSAFVLDDSMAMAPNLRLSGFESITIGARISRSGNATPQPGDLVGEGAAVAPGAQGLRIRIDQVQP